ncbi:Thioesterase super member 4 [Aspergillus nanangensis]|uniref:Thioesterase super member 4 n=1 Tax=Aspergillus nanangensis TaxID=2582783 RepID=A0AAD4GUY8_ASPNN|nr:Thioesterase super member 4 [Aspergillus nanangensis]
MSHLAKTSLRHVRLAAPSLSRNYNYNPIRTIKLASAVAQDPHTSTNTSAPAPTPIPTPTPTTPKQPPVSHRAQEIDSLISTLPLVQSLRADASYIETRPHLAMNPTHRPAHFVAGSLSGTNKITVPPFMWCATTHHPERSSPKSRIVSVFHIGGQLCGHPGFVHGGLLGVMFDETFARCVSGSFPSGTGMTANLNVDYRKPAVPERLYVLQAETVKVEGRKAWVEGSLSSLQDGESLLVAEARALFVEPKFAESMVSLYRQ